MEDVQSQRDERGITLDRVGVLGVRVPISVLAGSEGARHTVARAKLSVEVHADEKGAHMSRFLQVLETFREDLSLAKMATLAEVVAERLEARVAEVELGFPCFLRKSAPVSGESALMDFEVVWRGVATRNGEGYESRVSQAIEVEVASLCPCSKAISDYGAHNQRGRVSLDIEPLGLDAPAIHELVAIAERHASSPLYPVLKRPDERYVTMYAYDHPAFVEDIARGVADELRADPRLRSYRVRVVNQESIHAHDAFAEVSWRRAEDGR